MLARVKWFNNFKGYGFLNINGDDVFVHYKQILNRGFKTLSENEIVNVGNIITTEKGMQAQAVSKIQM